MKTLKCVFTDTKLTNKELKDKREYTFNTKEKDITIGTMLKSKSYKNNIQVVDIMLDTFEYVNIISGELKHERESSKDIKLKEFSLAEESPFASVEVVFVDVV